MQIMLHWCLFNRSCNVSPYPDPEGSSTVFPCTLEYPISLQYISQLFFHTSRLNDSVKEIIFNMKKKLTSAELCSSNALFDLDFPSSLRFLSAWASLLCLSNCNWMLSNVSCSFTVFNSLSKPAKLKFWLAVRASSWLDDMSTHNNEDYLPGIWCQVLWLLLRFFGGTHSSILRTLKTKAACCYRMLEIYYITEPQWLPGALSLWVKWQGYETIHSPSSSAKVKKDGTIYLLPIHLPGIMHN